MSEEKKIENTLTNIFVGRLGMKTTGNDLRRYFQRFGEVVTAYIVGEFCEGGSKGYGFVKFRDAESAARALENPNPVFDGRIANCEYQTNYEPTQKGSSIQARPSHKYQPNYQGASTSQQYQAIPQYYPPILMDPVSGQYYYLYNNPYCSYPTPMSYYQDRTKMMKQNDQGNTVVVENANKITIVDGVDGDQEKVELSVADEEDGNIKQDSDTTKELHKEAVQEDDKPKEFRNLSFPM